MLLALTQPAIFFGVRWLGLRYFSQLHNVLASLPGWPMLLRLLLPGDLTHYG